MVGGALNLQAAKRHGGPVCVGSGFIALDRVYREGSNALLGQFAGGSCGNVMTILSFLGWKSLPVGRLSNNPEAESLVKDLASFKVSTKFIRREHHGVTPVIIQRLKNRADGTPYHRFEWRSPDDGRRLPSYRPMPQRLATEMRDRLPQCRVFYFDRADRASFILASKMHEYGTLVFFEPSSIKDLAMFAKCLSVSHVVKYSADRIARLPDSTSQFRPVLEIQTLGEAGLRYRLKQANARVGPWRMKKALEVTNLKDACGSGDWCSAGMLSVLCADPADHSAVFHLDAEKVGAAISFGQALAAVNCEYEGARGAMYAFRNRRALLKEVGERM